MSVGYTQRVPHWAILLAKGQRGFLRGVKGAISSEVLMGKGVFFRGIKG